MFREGGSRPLTSPSELPTSRHFPAKLASVGATCHDSDALIASVFSRAGRRKGKEGEEGVMCCSRSFQILPFPHLPAQLILSLGYYQEGARRSSVTEKRPRSPRPWVGINLVDKISHNRFAGLSFSRMLPLSCTSEG